MPVNARFILLLAFVYSSAFAVAVPLDSRRVSDTVIEDGTPLGVSNRYHHFAGARDVPALGDSLRRSSQVSPRSPPISAFDTASDATSGTASKVLGRRDPPGPEAAAGPPPVKAGPPGPPPPMSGPPPPMPGPPGPQGPPGPPGSNPPYPYPYPYPYPFPIPEREREHEHEYPHEFHGHEQFMEHEGEHTMYHEYPPHEYPHYPHDDYPRLHHDDYPYEDYPRGHPEFVRYHHFEDLHATEFPHDEYRHPNGDFGPPRDRYPPSHEFFYGRPGSEFEEEHFSGQRGSQREKVSGERIEGSEFGSDTTKRPNSIAVPSASSVDLASAKLPARANPEASGAQSSNSNEGSNISSLFSSLDSRGDSDSSQLEGRDNIPIPLPSAMSLGKIEQRAAKGNEVNEVAVEDRRTNPVEKLVTL